MSLASTQDREREKKEYLMRVLKNAICTYPSLPYSHRILRFLFGLDFLFQNLHSADVNSHFFLFLPDFLSS